MKVERLLSENILALLRARGFTQHDLAFTCGKTDAWLSAILNGTRGIGVEDLDKIADFFGYRPYQLLIPGIARASERRRMERRSQVERRVGPTVRVAQELAQEIQRAHPRALPDEAASAELSRLRAAITRLSLDIAQLAGAGHDLTTMKKPPRKRSGG